MIKKLMLPYFILAFALPAVISPPARAETLEEKKAAYDLAAREYYRLGKSIRERERTSVNSIEIKNLHKYQYFDASTKSKIEMAGFAKCSYLLAKDSDLSTSGIYNPDSVRRAMLDCPRECQTKPNLEICNSESRQIVKYSTQLSSKTCGEIWDRKFPHADFAKKSFDESTLICSAASKTKACWSFSGEVGQWGADEACRKANPALSAAARKRFETKKAYDAALAAAAAQQAPVAAPAPASDPAAAGGEGASDAGSAL